MKTKPTKRLYKNVNTDLNQRWEDGIDHHPKSYELMKHLQFLDWEYQNDYFCFKVGGDGDNGEFLMNLMDLYFEMKDREDKKQNE